MIPGLKLTGPRNEVGISRALLGAPNREDGAGLKSARRLLAITPAWSTLLFARDS